MVSLHNSQPTPKGIELHGCFGKHGYGFFPQYAAYTRISSRSDPDATRSSPDVCFFRLPVATKSQNPVFQEVILDSVMGDHNAILLRMKTCVSFVRVKPAFVFPRRITFHRKRMQDLDLMFANILQTYQSLLVHCVESSEGFVSHRRVL